MPRAQTGKMGEDYACDQLLMQGMEILARNYHTRFGEIDIIARDGDCIVFAEVKTRASNALYPPELAVTEQKRNKIIKSAYIYLESTGTRLQPRFDVLAVTVRDRGAKVLKFEHYKNAFDGF